MSAAPEILGRVSVAGILSNLGCEVPKRGTRTRCPIHHGANRTLSYDEAKGVWYCFACGQGGGKVQLVQRALGYQPKPALEWLADLAGVRLSTWTPVEARERAAKWHAASVAAEWLVQQREDTIGYLRSVRECVQIVYHFAIRTGHTEYEAELWAKIRDLDRKVQWHLEAPWEQLAEIYYDVIARQGAL